MNEIKQVELCEKFNRIQIAASEKNAKTIRKMFVQKHKNVIRNGKRTKSLIGDAALTHLVPSERPVSIKRPPFNYQKQISAPGAKPTHSGSTKATFMIHFLLGELFFMQ